MSLKFRPFAVLGLTLLLALFVILYFDYNLSVLVIGLGGLLLLIALIFKSIRERLVPMYVAVAMIIAGAGAHFTCNDAYNLSETYADKTVNIEGLIIAEPDYSNFRYYYILELDRIDGQTVDCKLRLSLPYKISAEAFDSISLDAKVYKIASQSKEVQNYYYSKGILLGAYALEDEDLSVQVTRTNNHGFSFEKSINMIRERLISNIMQKLPNEYGATVVGMLLGDKSGLSDARVESFREAGVAPIFAVSGLHLSIWIMGLYSILDKFNIKKRTNSVIGIFFTVVFMFLAGLSPSVCRAGLMMLMLLSANLFYRKSDSLNSLGFAGFTLCILNPFIVVDTGFLLSFSATLAIVTLVPLADKYIFSKIPENFAGKFLKSVLTALSVGFSASVGVLPVTILFIGKISLYSMFSNFLFSPIATVCMLFGGLSAVSYPVKFISDFLALISGLCAKFMLTVIDFICDTSVTTFSTDNVFWKCGAICSVCILIFAVITFKGKGVFKAITVGLAVNFLVFGLFSYYYYNGLTQISILNVGNGISAVVRDQKDKLVLTGEADDYLKPLKINEKLEQISTENPTMILCADKDAAYDPTNLNLIKSIDYGTVILPKVNDDIKMLTAGTKLVETSYANINVLDNDSIRINIQKTFSLAYCQFDDITLLILFDSYKNARIPQEYLKADYLVCCGYIPQCIQPQLYENVIVCGEKERSQLVCDYVLSCGGNPVLVDDYDEILINVRDSKHNLLILEES